MEGEGEEGNNERKGEKGLGTRLQSFPSRSDGKIPAVHSKSSDQEERKGPDRAKGLNCQKHHLDDRDCGWVRLRSPLQIPVNYAPLGPLLAPNSWSLTWEFVNGIFGPLDLINDTSVYQGYLSYAYENRKLCNHK